MNLKDKINADLKAAMLARDELTATTIKGLKSAILYEEVAVGKREEGLNDAEIEAVTAKEVKKRDDAIAMYKSAGDSERADKEIRERAILEQYLPAQLSDDELRAMVTKVVADGNFAAQDFGRVIGAVKKEAGNAATGETIATIVKEYFQ